VVSDDERAARLAAIAAETAACTRCRLCQSAVQAVPGDGPPDSAIMFIGEAPGYYEDRQGRPFVGAAGQLLDELLARIGLRREEVFVTNIVKHRPPGNRDPSADEIEACAPFLREQIALVDPRVVVTLGRFALERFMPGARISQVHGQARRVDGRLFMPILHPAAALHQPAWRSQLEADFEALRVLLAAGDDGAAAEETGAPAEPAGEQLALF
jgi:DNA polymerase